MATTQLPPDDQPPVPTPRRVNRGLLWAAGLATVVLAVATLMAFRSDSDPSDDVVRLDPDATQTLDDLGPGADVVGQQLPALTYTTFDGASATLATRGKPLVINFWQSTCAPCVTEMPAIEATYLAHSDTVDVLGLDFYEAVESGQAMVDKTGVTYPIGRDATGELMRALGGNALPHTVVVAADGTIVATHQGALTQAQLQSLLDQATSETS